jgi:type IV pilus assembly protein PilO
VKQTLATAKKLAAEIDFLREKSRLLELEVSDLQKRLPKSKDIPDLLRRITRNAQRFGVKIRNFQPRPAVAQTEYDELPFDLSMTSNFHSLGNFFAEIGQEERLLAVRNLSLSVQKGTDKSITVGGTFKVIAYMAKGST